MALTKNSTTPAPTQTLSSENHSSSVEPKAHRSPRRILSEHQKREVARLYAKTTTPVPEIKRQFGIAESSLYQLIQQRGGATRGRVPVANGPVLKSAPQPTASNGNVPTSGQSVRARSNVSRRQTPSLTPSSKSRIAYRVSFAALQIVTAVDIRDALRQAEHLGATEITAIVRSE